MVLYEVMKFCNQGGQSQFETSNLNSHWINTNNTSLLGFLVPDNGNSWLSSWIISKYVIIHSLKLDITKILL